MENRIECHECKTIFKIPDTFLDINISFDQQNCKAANILDMIREAFKKEELKDSNKYFCENCKKHSELASKYTIITKYPPYFIISAQRFYFDPFTADRIKILNFLEVYEEIHLADISQNLNEKEIINSKDPNGLYELYAFIVHSGPNPDSGHYFSFAKDYEDPKLNWYLFNDSHVKCLGKTPQLNALGYQQTPYILFYVKKEYLKNSIVEVSKK